MKARGLLAISLCALAALLVPPASAGAKPGYVVKKKSLALSFGVDARNGYGVSVVTDGHRQVKVLVSKGGFLAAYTATGRVTRRGIEADFGRFGQISLRFRSRDRFRPRFLPGIRLPKPLRTECKGRAPVGERGIFRGNFRFEGERGFTGVRLHRVKGTVERHYKRICKRRRGASASEAEERLEMVFLRAEAQRFGMLRFFDGFELSITDSSGESEDFTVAFGGFKDKIGRVGVTKLILLLEDLDSMTVTPPDVRPVTVELAMREPFEGTATYLQEGKAPPTWSGTFGVRIPGSGLIPLAGPEFEADICRAAELPEFRRCTTTKFDAQALYGSGSHSQPLALARLSSLR